MSELFFVIKMCVVTAIVVVLMQIRVGTETVETQVHAWLQTSTPSLFLREVAEGGLKATHDVWASVTSGVKTKYWEKFQPDKFPGNRQLKMQMERSEVFLEEQKNKAQSRAEKLIQETSSEAAKEADKDVRLRKAADETTRIE